MGKVPVFKYVFGEGVQRIFLKGKYIGMVRARTVTEKAVQGRIRKEKPRERHMDGIKSGKLKNPQKSSYFLRDL